MDFCELVYVEGSGTGTWRDPVSEQEGKKEGREEERKKKNQNQPNSCNFVNRTSVEKP